MHRPSIEADAAPAAVVTWSPMASTVSDASCAALMIADGDAMKPWPSATARASSPCMRRRPRARAMAIPTASTGSKRLLRSGIGADASATGSLLESRQGQWWRGPGQVGGAQRAQQRAEGGIKRVEHGAVGPGRSYRRVVTSGRRSSRMQFAYAEYLAVAGAEALERILAG